MGSYYAGLYGPGKLLINSFSGPHTGAREIHPSLPAAVRGGEENNQYFYFKKEDTLNSYSIYYGHALAFLIC